MFIATESIPSSFRGFTLIMPAVSVGNVGQLATDLIISTLGMPRVGYIHTDCLIPMAGNDPYPTCADDAAELSTNAEVYCLPDVKLAVLQIRAPFVQRKSRKFRKLILSWIKSSGFDRTVVLSSSHAYQRDDQQLLGAPLRYLLSPVLEQEAGTQLNTLEWKEIEQVSAFPGINDSDKRLYIPGGGITKGLYTDGCSEGIKMAVLLIFCSEGDNIPDAFALVNYLNDWLHLVDKPSQMSTQWRVPGSWRLLFGSGIPPAIF
ncbi:proteasome assembly chaperone 2 [Paramormyrops kingsleyae]|uniref:Proteasome assembly chaperone 2 n=1 Tax=Paramormyrops kingsleyae TaxID=1676925 RepID=A0A3B3R2H5_9TELE|nr:proteasome assembly chaperone 2 [Paramormyrops kingsleyae]